VGAVSLPQDSQREDTENQMVVVALMERACRNISAIERRMLAFITELRGVWLPRLKGRRAKRIKDKLDAVEKGLRDSQSMSHEDDVTGT